MHGSRKERKDAVRRESRLFVKGVGATVENESNSADLGFARQGLIRTRVCAGPVPKISKPEMVGRSLLNGMGYRFTVNGPKNRTPPAKPDIVLPKYRTVIFVHGCFWHRHKGCKDATTPKTRTEWWEAKFTGNVERARRNQRSLRKEGWRVVVVWECEMKNAAQLRGVDLSLSRLRNETT